jgi:hypothetical protein
MGGDGYALLRAELDSSLTQCGSRGELARWRLLRSSAGGMGGDLE